MESQKIKVYVTMTDVRIIEVLSQPVFEDAQEIELTKEEMKRVKHAMSTFWNIQLLLQEEVKEQTIENNNDGSENL